MGEILPFPFEEMGSVGQVRIVLFTGRIDISIFFYFVAKKNMGRIYYFSPHSIKFFVNVNSQPIHFGKFSNKMRSVDGSYDFDVIVRAFVRKMVQYPKDVLF